MSGTRCETCRWFDSQYRQARCLFNPPVVAQWVNSDGASYETVRAETTADSRCSKWEPASGIDSETP